MNLFNLKKNTCKIIAEVGQLHDGNINIAHNIIDKLHETKVDAVKFQTHYADEESTIQEPWRVNFSKKDRTRFDYWRRMEFSINEWLELKKHCEKLNMEFLSSPFSPKAVNILKKIGIKYFKIASGEVSNSLLMNEVLKTRIPLIISSGMSNIHEIDKIIRKLKIKKIKFALLQCTSQYPCKAEDLGLNNLKVFKDRYKCLTGFSDHSGNVFAALAAISLGANFIETHVTFSKDYFGPDSSSSLTFEEIKQLVEGRDYILKIINNPVQKNKFNKILEKNKKIFTKSIVLNKDLNKNQTIKLSDISLKKPNIGLNSNMIDQVVGKKLKTKMKKNKFLKFKDLI